MRWPSSIESKSTFTNVEIMVKARDLGYRLTEVEIEYVPREHGEQKGAKAGNILKTIIDMCKFWPKWVLHRKRNVK